MAMRIGLAAALQTLVLSPPSALGDDIIAASRRGDLYRGRVRWEGNLDELRERKRSTS